MKPLISKSRNAVKYYFEVLTGIPKKAFEQSTIASYGIDYFGAYEAVKELAMFLFQIILGIFVVVLAPVISLFIVILNWSNLKSE